MSGRAVFRAFVLADVARVMSGPHIATEIVFVALTILGIRVSRHERARGVLT